MPSTMKLTDEQQRLVAQMAAETVKFHEATTGLVMASLEVEGHSDPQLTALLEGMEDLEGRLTDCLVSLGVEPW